MPERRRKAAPVEATPPAAQLPAEVLDLLSLGGKVRLAYADHGENRVIDVPVAPLVEGLMLIVPAKSPALAALELDPACVLTAEDPGLNTRAWRVVSRGRAVPGRRILAEPLRVQLSYWLPDDAKPGGGGDEVAVRFLPEHLEYVRGADKFYGPVPNARMPDGLVAWWTLALDRQWAWIVFLVLTNFVAGMAIDATPTARFVLVGATMLPAFVLLCGLVLWNHGAVAQRWREGLEPEARAWAALRGWIGSTTLRSGGIGVMAAGAAMLPILGFVQPRLVPIALFSSGFGFLAPFYGVRHYFRHADGDRLPSDAGRDTLPDPVSPPVQGSKGRQAP